MRHHQPAALTAAQRTIRSQEVAIERSIREEGETSARLRAYVELSPMGEQRWKDISLTVVICVILGALLMWFR